MPFERPVSPVSVRADPVSRRLIPLFRASGVAGYLPDIQAHPHKVTARKRPLPLKVEFATAPCVVETLEGAVSAAPGDAIITGTAGERWPVNPERFKASYEPVPPTQAGQSGTYRTLPAKVIGVPMSKRFEVLLADGVSLLHGGRGDWLVDYGDGNLGIISHAVFPTVYEIIG